MENYKGFAWKKSQHWNRKWLSLWGSELSKISRMRAFDWWDFGADPLLRLSDSCQRASASWLLTGLRSAIGGVWNTGVGTGIGALTQSVIDMRNSGRIHTVEFRRFHWKWGWAGSHQSARCPRLETFRPPWEAGSEATDSSVGEGNGITPGGGSCRLARHQSLKHDRNRCESVNSVKNGVWRDGSEG